MVQEFSDIVYEPWRWGKASALWKFCTRHPRRPSPRPMNSLTLTTAQIDTLRGLPAHFEPERIDRIWIFPPHFGKARESGLFVVSLRSDDDDGPQHTLMTVVYEVTPTQGKSVRVESAVEQGRAHP